MQIVIEIDERDFQYCQALDRINMGNSVNKAIVNGTPFPEHHGRLIDAEFLKFDYSENKHLYFSFEDAIDMMPTIIPATKEGE